MTTEEHRLAGAGDAEKARLVETARWHTLRYDNLRASLANRASFVVSANAVLIAGASFLFSWTAGRGFYGGTASLVLMGLGMLLVLIFALLSVRAASRALLSNKPWRKLLNAEPPRSLFYQHSDTIKAVPTYEGFSAAFKKQTPDSEVESALVNLWQELRTHAYRYGFLRTATSQLQIATIAFAGSAIIAMVLAFFR